MTHQKNMKSQVKDLTPDYVTPDYGFVAGNQVLIDRHGMGGVCECKADLQREEKP